MTEFSELVIAKIKDKWGDAVVTPDNVIISNDIGDWSNSEGNYEIDVPTLAPYQSLIITAEGTEGDFTLLTLDGEAEIVDTLTDLATTEASFTLTIASLTGVASFRLTSTEVITGITITGVPLTPAFIPLPRFIDDYTLASSESSQYDVIYLQESSNTRIARGIGYKDRQEDLLVQLHLYGPNVTRGYKVRDELERIIDDRGTRVRLDDLSLLFTDNRTRRAMKVGYGYVYDLRVSYLRRME